MGILFGHGGHRSGPSHLGLICSENHEGIVPSTLRLLPDLQSVSWTQVPISNLRALDLDATFRLNHGDDLPIASSNRVINGQHRPPLEEEATRIADSWKGPHSCEERYCVWSNTGFSGQGMSIVTTMANHQRVERLPKVTARLEGASSHFLLAAVPGKGLGLIATRKIRRGERIMAVQPAILVHLKFIEESELEDQYRLLELAVNKLPTARKDSFMAQAGDLGGHRISDVIFTNSFQMSLGEEDGFHLGNFPEVSRFNHDCRPNVAFYIDNNLTHHTHAVRDIHPGEELSISYLDSFQARSVRQERARASWGFSCSCSQCSLSKTEADASDARLFSIYQIENEISDFSNQEASPALVERLISLYREERLEFRIAGAYTIAALKYNLFGKAKLAKKYAELAVEAGIIENGPDAADVRAMRELADDPKGHWSWNQKPRR
ncbi:uncharacterized protein BCR38DRAFT_473569 [Pseudomassariella vexata]|uniref:SET domain-containing protein n=1 Tax=Pseudomassariella vexata TaxID=1141098 RepID=A0A1Y2E412_9PEZI|nr:uncharacterized protein BCR38DRAFT_473569 [Pseudomassariella vexata]ORY66298.1 hypothetical protein BCR38DRAFT_473569 [Pseudomassariella vexata]